MQVTLWQDNILKWQPIIHTKKQYVPSISASETSIGNLERVLLAISSSSEKDIHETIKVKVAVNIKMCTY